MKKGNKIKCILMDFEIDEITLDEAAQKLLDIHDERNSLHSFMDYCNGIEGVWAEEFRAWIEDYLDYNEKKEE
jgi:hypothetical protein